MWRSKVISTRWYACFIRQTDNPLQVEKEIMSVGDLATALVCLAREKKKKKLLQQSHFFLCWALRVMQRLIHKSEHALYDRRCQSREGKHSSCPALMRKGWADRVRQNPVFFFSFKVSTQFALSEG